MKSFMAVLQWIETKPSLADAPTWGFGSNNVFLLRPP